MLGIESKLGLSYWLKLPEQNGKQELTVRVHFQDHGAAVSPINFRKLGKSGCNESKINAFIDPPTGAHTRDEFLGRCHLSQVTIVKNAEPIDAQLQKAAEGLAETLTKLLNGIDKDKAVPNSITHRVTVETRRTVAA